MAAGVTKNRVYNACINGAIAGNEPCFPCLPPEAESGGVTRKNVFGRDLRGRIYRYFAINDVYFIYTTIYAFPDSQSCGLRAVSRLMAGGQLR
jgi:hypothetical protein